VTDILVKIIEKKVFLYIFREGHLSIVELLVAKGADLEMTDIHGHTSLHLVIILKASIFCQITFLRIGIVCLYKNERTILFEME
jgi:hypothetical protein